MIFALHKYRPSLCSPALIALLFAMFTSLPAVGAENPLSPAPFAGTFSNDKLAVQLSESGDGYAGTISMNGRQFPAKATADGQQLSGVFTASGNQFDFTATLANDQMTLVSGKNTYTLTRAAENPLDQSSIAPEPSPSQPGSPAPAASGDSDGVQTLGSFSILGTTANGKTLFIKLPSASTLDAAITQTADELGKVCDGKLTLGGAFAVAQSKDKGGAVFSAKVNGAEVRALIFSGVGAGGGSSTVILASPSASKDEMAALFGFMPAPLKMQTHQYPDNSGSVDLPDGWTAIGTSAVYGVAVKGPAGQAVVFGNTQTILMPNSTLVRQGKQTYQIQLQNYNTQMRNYQQLLAMHQRYPNTVMSNPPVKPTPPNDDPNVAMPLLNFCRECAGAEEVLKYWYPIAEQKARAKGGPFSTLDKILAVAPAEANPYIQGSKSGVAYLAVTDHDGDKITHMRVINRIATAPIVANENWQLSMSVMRAPDATFDRDLLVMNAIMNSIKLNMDVVNNKIASDGAAIRKIGEDNERELLKRGREFQQAQADQFDRFESQIAAQQQAVHDSSSDMIEYCLGVRDVYDRATGQMSQVDLFNSHGIVQGLNDAALDPGRFVEIPLRYER